MTTDNQSNAAPYNPEPNSSEPNSSEPNSSESNEQNLDNLAYRTSLFESNYIFPNPNLVDPEGIGLIAMGGDLEPETILTAYSQGLFPWFNEDEPVAWWSPEPRCILDPTSFKPSRSLKRLAKSSQWHWTVNTAFEEVMQACSLPRSYAEDTWIHGEMIEAYTHLHKLGYAHSIEVWDDKDLVGGLYGLKIGQIYFGESMFHTQSNASKIAFWALNNFCQFSDVQLIDCQLPNPHLQSLGAKEMPRKDFLAILEDLVWQQSKNWNNAANTPYAVSKLHESIQPIPVGDC